VGDETSSGPRRQTSGTRQCSTNPHCYRITGLLSGGNNSLFSLRYTKQSLFLCKVLVASLILVRLRSKCVRTPVAQKVQDRNPLRPIATYALSTRKKGPRKEEQINKRPSPHQLSPLKVSRRVVGSRASEVSCVSPNFLRAFQPTMVGQISPRRGGHTPQKNATWSNDEKGVQQKVHGEILGDFIHTLPKTR